MKDNNKGYSYNPEGFFICENNVLYDDKLSDKAKMLYMHITNRYNFFLWANQMQKDGCITEVDKVYCESQAVMAKALGYSATSASKVNKLIAQLEEHGWVKIYKKRDGKNSNWYVPCNSKGQPNITIPHAEGNVMVGSGIPDSRKFRTTPQVKKPDYTTGVMTPIEGATHYSDDEDDDWTPF